MTLVPCAACDRHIRRTDHTCPFCGGPARVNAASGPQRAMPAEQLCRAALALFAAATAGAGCGGRAVDTTRTDGGNSTAGTGGYNVVAPYGAPPPFGGTGAGGFTSVAGAPSTGGTTYRGAGGNTFAAGGTGGYNVVAPYGAPPPFGGFAGFGNVGGAAPSGSAGAPGGSAGAAGGSAGAHGGNAGAAGAAGGEVVEDGGTTDSGTKR